jgi:predicted 3-demethylubiquinone-9 3-methyltransferase (glyoxalase superfamily)
MSGALILALPNWMTDQKRYGNLGMIKTKHGCNWQITLELLIFMLG